MKTIKTIEQTVERTAKSKRTLSRSISLITTCALLATVGVSQAQWVGTEIGRATKGAFTATDEVVTMEGVGWDIWGDSDGFYFVHQQVRGDGEFVARLTRHQGRNFTWEKAGIMIRQSLDANSKHVLLCFSNYETYIGNGLYATVNVVACQHRRVNGGDSFSATMHAAEAAFGGPTVPLWLKLRRTGNTVLASWSQDGVTWDTNTKDPVSGQPVPMTVNLTLPENVYIGFGVSSSAWREVDYNRPWQNDGPLFAKFEEYSHTFSPLATSVEPILSVAMYPGLTISGAVGASYIIEYTQNPATGPWLTADQFVLPTSPWFWVDQTAPGNQRRFYRAVHLR